MTTSHLNLAEELTVSLLVEVSEPNHDAIRQFLKAHPEHDQDSVFGSAIALCLAIQGRERDA